MPLKFILDEHLRGSLYSAVLQHNHRRLGLPLDVVRVGDMAELPLGSLDETVLRWAEVEDRIVVTLDQASMPTELQKHLQAGEHSPGVLILKSNRPRREIVEYLELVAHACQKEEFWNAVRYGP